MKFGDIGLTNSVPASLMGSPRDEKQSVNSMISLMISQTAVTEGFMPPLGYLQIDKIYL